MHPHRRLFYTGQFCVLDTTALLIHLLRPSVLPMRCVARFSAGWHEAGVCREIYSSGPHILLHIIMSYIMQRSARYFSSRIIVISMRVSLTPINHPETNS